MNWWENAQHEAWHQPLPTMPDPFPVRPPGLGTRLAHFLKRLGIRQKPGCGCAKRQSWLDRHFPLQFISKFRKR